MHDLLLLLLTAANVTIIGIHQTDGYHAYLAEVTQTWILDEENCSQHNGLTYILVRASYSHCNRCPDLSDTAGSSGVDNVYLIGGYCNNRGWTLPPNDSLASLWYSHSRYQTKISEWVQSGIADRQRQNQQHWDLHMHHLHMSMWVGTASKNAQRLSCFMPS